MRKLGRCPAGTSSQRALCPPTRPHKSGPHVSESPYLRQSPGFGKERVTLDPWFSENVAPWLSRWGRETKDRGDVYLAGSCLWFSQGLIYIRDRFCQGALGPGPGGQKDPGLGSSCLVLCEEVKTEGQEYRRLVRALRPATWDILNKSFTHLPTCSTNVYWTLTVLALVRSLRPGFWGSLFIFKWTQGSASKGVGKTG